MTLLRFDPFRDPFRDLDRLTSQLASGVRTPALMPMDAWKQADTYHVALDLPDVHPASIELTVERSTLTVHALRQSAFGEDAEGLVAERPQGSFTRQLMLGEGLDSEQVQADYTNGVLHLTIPVKQTSQPRRIEVTTGGQSAAAQPTVIDMTEGQDSASQQAGSSAG